MYKPVYKDTTGQLFSAVYDVWDSVKKNSQNVPVVGWLTQEVEVEEQYNLSRKRNEYKLSG